MLVTSTIAGAAPDVRPRLPTGKASITIQDDRCVIKEIGTEGATASHEVNLRVELRKPSEPRAHNEGHPKDTWEPVRTIALEVDIQSSDDQIWWFDVAPTPHHNRRLAVCLVPEAESQVSRSWPLGSYQHRCDTYARYSITATEKHESPPLSRRNESQAAAVVMVEVNLPLTGLAAGFHEVSVWLTEAAPPRRIQAVAKPKTLIWVVDKGADKEELNRRLEDIANRARDRDTALDKEEREIWQRQHVISQGYKPLHPELRNMKPREMLHPSLRAALEAGSPDAIHDLLRPVSPSIAKKFRGDPLLSPVRLSGQRPAIVAFPLFNPEFCRLLISEAKPAVHIQQQTQAAAGNSSFTRPNSMNNYGFILEELGLDPRPLVREVLAPLAEVVFPDWGGSSLDSVHAFTISYSMSGDRDLDRHMDQSEVTVNVNLGGDFNGGELYFNGQRDSPLNEKESTTMVHQPSVAVMHAGQHWHGARQLSSGERHNLVVWMRSRDFKSSPAHLFSKRCSINAAGRATEGHHRKPGRGAAATDEDTHSSRSNSRHWELR